MAGRHKRLLVFAIIILFLASVLSGCSFSIDDPLGLGEEAVTMTIDGVPGEYPVLEVMARLVAAEARGEPEVGQVAVAAVILNRVKSPYFPNTIAEVMTQNIPTWQFAPMKDAYDLMFAAIDYEVAQAQRYGYESVLDRAMRAISRAQNGEDPTGGALFFRTVKESDYPIPPGATVIGVHIFSLQHI